ncbi:hypothetical protein KCG43_20235 [Photobacterium sp. WH24]|uniref:hypothetical protein n=1 Tax=Photobacterium sp. WH24 TaxID=2827237 RepID=UPI001C4577D6|nr:hypothetical protein [Photobacterium sp. WH24]MBV7264344.1 hypothetical protein [Photobacterium sp. WH24]
MKFDASEHLQGAEITSQQLTAIAVAAGESADQLDQNTLALCFQVIERLGRECQAHLKQVEVTLQS